MPTIVHVELPDGIHNEITKQIGDKYSTMSEWIRGACREKIERGKNGFNLKE